MPNNTEYSTGSFYWIYWLNYGYLLYCISVLSPRYLYKIGISWSTCAGPAPPRLARCSGCWTPSSPSLSAPSSLWASWPSSSELARTPCSTSTAASTTTISLSSSSPVSRWSSSFTMSGCTTASTLGPSSSACCTSIASSLRLSAAQGAESYTQFASRRTIDTR